MSVELCIEENCEGEIFCINMCLKHYKKWYYSVKLTNKIKGIHNYKLASLGLSSLLYTKEPELIRKGNSDFVPFSERAHESHIKHENKIFALAAGTDYKRMPSILTIDNYEQEQTVGNSIYK